MAFPRFINDFKEPRSNARRIIPEAMQQRGEFTFSYIALLLSSTVVCTLGLITNSSAVIIGGMIIAPLMWPMLKMSYALATRRQKLAGQSFAVLLISILTIGGGAAAVAFASPLNPVTEEILARTAPTTLEIFIALAAAVIAALAVAHPKIGETIAGVAVAISLVPPLCVTGIGIAYFNADIAVGSFLLFLTNVVTIILASTLIFTVFIYGSEFSRLKSRSMLALVALLLIIAWPLSLQLRTSVVNARVTSLSREAVVDQLNALEPSSELQEFSAVLNKSETRITIRAVVLVSPTRTLTFEQEKQMRDKLEEELDKDVNLRLILQDSLSLVSTESVEESTERTILEEELQEKIHEINNGIRINTIDSKFTESGQWDVLATVRVGNQDIIDDETVIELERAMTDVMEKPVNISVDVIESRLVR